MNILDFLKLGNHQNQPDQKQIPNIKKAYRDIDFAQQRMIISDSLWQVMGKDKQVLGTGDSPTKAIRMARNAYGNNIQMILVPPKKNN